jgi:hypothetical protein
VISLAAWGGAGASASPGAGPVAHAAAACNGLRWNRGPIIKLAGGYYLSLHVKGVSCAAALKVQDAFTACRVKHGPHGHCTTAVLGYRCTETRPASQVSAISFNGNVSCRRGSKSITYGYQQNTG